MYLTLMHKDTPVLVAAYEKRAHSFSSISALLAPTHAPAATFDPYGHVTLARLNRWWDRRAIPRTRDGYDRLAQNLNIDEPSELLEDARGLSLSDTYWLRQEDEPVTWHDVNYFDNAFDGELGLVTLGESSAQRYTRPKASPSASTGGDLRKAWIIDKGGRRMLLKSGRGLAAQEVFNELAATRLYERIMPSGDFVAYELVQRRGRVYSSCANMLDGSQDLVTAADLCFARKKRGNQSDYEWCVSALEATGVPDIERTLCRMLACDYVLGNFDRHYNNFGLIRDAKTLEFRNLAPIYDSGNSLWCDRTILDSPADYAYEPLPFGYANNPERIPSPAAQLTMLGDWRWYESGMFRDAPSIVRTTLSQDENIPPARIEKIAAQVARNVQTLEAHARHRVWRGSCTERMRAAGKAVDPVPCMEQP